MPSARPVRPISRAKRTKAGGSFPTATTMAHSPAPRWNGRPCSSCLADIRAGKIDIVVVYKVDRLTRSLADFAKLIELFDAHGVSFVSVTQSFNTSSSMGRLTLNVLLSFAQFERELIGERVRDKIAASKRKGLWVGGPVPLGYAAVDKKIVVVPAEAEAVRTIFAALSGAWLDPRAGGGPRSARAFAASRGGSRPAAASAAAALAWARSRICSRTASISARWSTAARFTAASMSPILDSTLFEAVQGKACGPGGGAALPAARLTRRPERAPV